MVAPATAPVETAPLAKAEVKSEAKVEAKVETKVDRPTPASGIPPAAATNCLPAVRGPEPPPARADKPCAQVADPLTGLDFLEADMARLLGREKS